MNYYIADMHLFCKSQTQEGRLNFDNRPFQNTEEMHQHFLEEWNKQITNGDTTYILGDLSLRGRNLAKKRAEGKHYNVAISHAAKKLVRLIYAMERSQQPYRPAA